MTNPGIIPTVLTAMGMVAGVLLGVWGIMARYDERVRNRIDAQGKETTEQLGQLRERMAKLEGLLEGAARSHHGKTGRIGAAPPRAGKGQAPQYPTVIKAKGLPPSSCGLTELPRQRNRERSGGPVRVWRHRRPRVRTRAGRTQRQPRGRRRRGAQARDAEQRRHLHARTAGLDKKPVRTAQQASRNAATTGGRKRVPRARGAPTTRGSPGPQRWPPHHRQRRPPADSGLQPQRSIGSRAAWPTGQARTHS